VETEIRVVERLVVDQIFEISGFIGSSNRTESHTENTRVWVTEEIIGFVIDSTKVLAHDGCTCDFDVFLG